MENALKRAVCPHCDIPADTPSGSKRWRCAACGREWDVEAAPIDQSPSEGDVDLIADLRAAFGFDSHDTRSRVVAGEASCLEGGEPSLSPGALSPGATLGDFEIISELGRGGMGVVYRARQISLGREVALKVLPGFGRRGRLAVQRFRAEAQAAARVHHTNVVPVYAQGEHAGHVFYAMELVDGVSLDAVIRSRPDLLSSTRLRGSSSWVRLPDRSGISAPSHDDPPLVDEPASEDVPVPDTPADYRHLAMLLSQVADALECAHQRGVIHRDIKPHNILLGNDLSLHLTDFGLARLVDEPHMTITGEVMGTPAYLSPEQIQAGVDQIDHRTDVYSLGVTLYELLTRCKPFDGDHRDQIIHAICHNDPTPPRQVVSTIPIDLETICLRAIEKSPNRRYQTAAAMAEDLRRFAEGRPILARRVSRIEKAIKWVRRHKALSAAIAASLAVLILGGGLGWSIQASRRAEAERLLTDAYEQLAYFDYRTPQRVRDQMDRAAALWAAPELRWRVRALVDIGESNTSDAIATLEAVRQRDPDDLLALYMLAWAQRRGDSEAAARETLDEADRRGPPAAADAWFFRGLALHFMDPDEAIVSYRRANAIRAREGAFYPQAVLHLARARNQRMYATRSLDGFEEAVASLEQLVDNGYYGAYPYYLLSISHRLAAEIYRGSEGIRGDALVAEHFSASLEWARRGQALDPGDNRSITAEAECLEQLGRYEEAIAARTRAITTAAPGPARCEGYHYRWRLRYWVGDLAAALDDIEAHAVCMPESAFYQHVYPALVLAEMGDMSLAVSHARELAPESATAMEVIWSATLLRLLGRPTEAADLLADRVETVRFEPHGPHQTTAWVRALYEMCMGTRRPAEMEKLAVVSDSPWSLRAEMWFHAGVLRLAGGDRLQGVAGLKRAHQAFDGELGYTFHARVLLEKLQQNPAWPRWMMVSWIPEERSHPSVDVAKQKL